MAENRVLQENVALFKACTRMEKTDRIPNLSCFFTWKFLDCDYPLDQVLTDYDLMEKVLQEFHDRYQFDAYADLGGRNQYKVMQALGDDVAYDIDIETGAVNYKENTIMLGEEYDEYINSKPQLMWKMFKRKYPNLTKGQLVQAIGAMMEFGQRSGQIQDNFIARNGTPMTLADQKFMVMFPVEHFFNYYRGVRNLSLDMRKHKAKLKEAIDKDFEEVVYPAFKQTFAEENTAGIADYYIPLLAHSFMSVKQFEEFFWPQMKRVIDDIVAAGKTVYIFTESSMMRLAEFFEDVPKGHIIIHPELDDVVELRKRLPNVCIAGGMKSHLLGTATPQECADYAKYLLDTMGEGYIFSQDKMMSFRNDCTRENLLAVNEVVRNYRP